jgi:hypothetical protein
LLKTERVVDGQGRHDVKGALRLAEDDARDPAELIDKQIAAAAVPLARGVEIAAVKGIERRGGDLSLSNPRIPNRQILGFLIDKLSGL